MSRRLITILSIYAGIILIYAAVKPQEIDWRESFSKDDKIPFGAYVLFEEIDAVMHPESRTVSETPLYNARLDSTRTDQVFLVVNKGLFVDELDRDRLLDFVAQGNTAFLSCSDFPDHFLDTLGLRTDMNYQFAGHITDWIYEPDLTVRLECLPDTAWMVATRGWYATLNMDSLPTGVDVTVLGTLEERPAFIRYPVGEGAIYLHSFPHAFTNFYILEEDNHPYAAAVLSHLPEQQAVIWDEYYKGTPAMYNNLLGVFVQRVSFRWAYWLIIAGVVLFIVFTAKRQQRPIPVVESPQNSSIRFVRTLGDLYFQKGNHMDLAQKKLLYFRDYLRHHYLLEVSALTPDEASRVSKRTGRAPDLVEGLFAVFRRVDGGDKVTAAQLTTLQHKLDQFFERTTHGE